MEVRHGIWKEALVAGAAATVVAAAVVAVFVLPFSFLVKAIVAASLLIFTWSAITSTIGT